jgi:hypothetical protein
VWFFVSRSLRDKSTIASVNEHQDAEGLTHQHKKSSLLTWVRRTSRGRFADTNGNHKAHKTKQRSIRKVGSTPSVLIILFVRRSLVPHIASVTAEHPHGQQFPSAIFSPLAGFPLVCTAPTKQALIQIPTVPQVFIPALCISLHSMSGPTLPSMMSLHPQMAVCSVSDLDSTLHPSSTMIKCLPSWPTVPSRALLLARETHGLNVIMQMPLVQSRMDARLLIGRIVGVSCESAER